MDNILDEHLEENIQLTDQDIFTRIWTSPRMVFKFINDNHYDKHVTVLLLLSGISSAFDRDILKNMGDLMPLFAVVMTCIVLGGLFGYIINYIYAALMSWTGRWVGGEGDTPSLLRMLAYAMVPSIIALIFIIPQVMIYGSEVFKSDGDIVSADVLSNIILYASMLFEFILGVFSFVFCVIGTSEVQKISIGKAILNLLLPLIIIMVPIIALVLLFV
jgi:hypothetical protein